MDQLGFGGQCGKWANCSAYISIYVYVFFYICIGMHRYMCIQHCVEFLLKLGNAEIVRLLVVVIPSFAAALGFRCSEGRESVSKGPHLSASMRPVHPIQLSLPLADGKESTVDVFCRTPGEVQFIFNEIVRDLCYGELDKLSPDSIVVDAGLNLGLFSLVLAHRWQGPGSINVLAFEPSAEAYSLAVRNLQHNNVKVISHGASPFATAAPHQEAAQDGCNSKNVS